MANCGPCDSQKYCPIHRPDPSQAHQETNSYLGMLDRIDSLEAVVAQLMAAYAEVWVVVESLLNELMSGRTEEEFKAFWEKLNEVRVEMFRDISKAGKSSVEGTDSDPASTMENLVNGQRTNTDG